MSVLLLDTNVVSILFKPDHFLHRQTFGIAAGHQWFISFMGMALLAAQGAAPGPKIIVSQANLEFAKANLAELGPKMDAADGIRSGK